MDVKRRHIKNAFGLDFNCLKGKTLCARLLYENKFKRIIYSLSFSRKKAAKSGMASFVRYENGIYSETVAIRFFSYILRLFIDAAAT
jgi:hypothetical protein